MAHQPLAQKLAREGFERGPWLIAAVDRSHRIRYHNRAFAQALDAAEGRFCYQVYKKRQQPCEPCHAATAFTDGQTYEIDEQLVCIDDQVKNYRIYGLPLFDEKGAVRYVLQVAIDWSAHTELAAQLAQAERLAAVGFSTAGLAHGIKNILGGLEGATYLVSSALEHSDPDRLRGGWEMVQKYIEQVSALVKNLLQYAKDRPLVREPVDVAKLMGDVAELFENKAAMVGVELTVDCPGQIPTICGQQDALHAAIVNLTTNALDACMWDPNRDKNHVIKLSAGSTATGGVYVEVSDNGMGMTEQNQNKALRSTFTTKGIRGTGLGLLLTNKAVKDHGGTIILRSTLGQGTTFRIELPASGEAPVH